MIQLGAVRVLQGVLILGFAGPTTNLDILVGLHEHLDPGQLVERRLQAPDDFGGADGALAERLEVDHHLALTDGRVRADPEVDAGDRRILTDHFRGAIDLRAHRERRNIRRRFGLALDQTVVLLRKEALGDADIQRCRRNHRCDGDGQGDALMIEHPIQAATVAVVQVLEHLVRKPGQNDPLPGRHGV